MRRQIPNRARNARFDVAALENVVFLADRREHINRAVNGFGRAEEKKAARFQSEMKSFHHALLRRRIQINQHIAARYKIEARKRRVFQNVVIGEQNPLAQFAPHAIAVAFFHEKPAQAFRGNVRRVVQSVKPFARRRNRGFVNVGRENLYFGRVNPAVVEPFGEQHPNRIRFLARRAAHHPNANLFARLFFVKDARNNVVFESGKRRLVAEKIRHRNQQIF